MEKYINEEWQQNFPIYGVLTPIHIETGMVQKGILHKLFKKKPYKFR